MPNADANKRTLGASSWRLELGASNRPAIHEPRSQTTPHQLDDSSSVVDACNVRAFRDRELTTECAILIRSRAWLLVEGTT